MGKADGGRNFESQPRKHNALNASKKVEKKMKEGGHRKNFKLKKTRKRWGTQN